MRAQRRPAAKELKTAAGEAIAANENPHRPEVSPSGRGARPEGLLV